MLLLSNVMCRYYDVSVGDRLVGQGLMIFFASAETTSIAVSYTLYEMSMNLAIQEKARSEILDVITRKGLNYESIKEMNYLEMCILGE